MARITPVARIRAHTPLALTALLMAGAVSALMLLLDTGLGLAAQHSRAAAMVCEVAGALFIAGAALQLTQTLHTRFHTPGLVASAIGVCGPILFIAWP